ncbi:MAG TPA: hypothetical protein VH309_05670 [Elusimicrobiota bacterium]|jgi:hypothetical protein|nr:hypothetical protein [Elusimicrobiota bacterium]
MMGMIRREKIKALLLGTSVLLAAIGIRYGISKHRRRLEDRKFEPACAAEVGTPDAALPNIDELKRSFHPASYAPPLDLAHFIEIPKGNGNAAEDFVAALKLMVVALGPEQFEKGYVFDSADPRLDQAFKRIDDAVAKPRNDMTGVLVVPTTRIEIPTWIVLATRLALFSGRYHALFQRAMAEGRYRDAREIARRSLAFSSLLTQDWNRDEQLLAATTALSGLLEIRWASRATHDWCRPDREAKDRLIWELQAYVDPKDDVKGALEPIAQSADKPFDPSGLSRYLENPETRSRLADSIMQKAFAAGVTTGSEAARGRQFLRNAARDRDPRVALLARGYLQALDDHQTYASSGTSDVGRVMYESALHLLERGGALAWPTPRQASPRQ